MARYILIPGAGGTAWFWHRVIPILSAKGHDAVAVELPGDDEQAGLPAYTDLVLAAIGDDPKAIVVALSLGGFTAAMVAARTPLAALIFVNAMIPRPGETPGDWWDAVGSKDARIAAAQRNGYSEKFDLETYFLHDVPPDLAKASEPYQRPEGNVVFGDRCDFAAWPAIPIRSLAGADDRFVPVELQRRLARERLGIEAEVVPGGHLAALSRPEALGRGDHHRTEAEYNRRMSLLVLIELKTRTDRDAEFLRVARALAAAAATEAGTLRYEWFATQKPGHYAVVEEYVDADAAEAHNNHVESLLRELFAAVDLVSASFYGELNAYIRDWIAGREGIAVHTPLPQG